MCVHAFMCLCVVCVHARARLRLYRWVHKVLDKKKRRQNACCLKSQTPLLALSWCGWVGGWVGGCTERKREKERGRGRERERERFRITIYK